MKPFTGIIVLLLALPTFNALSDEVDKLFELSLSDLLNVEISVASTTIETVVETPAIVSRYNRVDLEKMGITTLAEMFNFIPGVIVQDGLTGWSTVQIRGIDEAFNQKVLFLLDGVPYHQPSHSIIPMEGIPWQSISHVEVIRGPGAVFYGSQASAGVFNVVTRKDSQHNVAMLKLGSNKLKEGSVYYNYPISADSAIAISAEYRDEDGHTVTYQQNLADVGLISNDVTRYLEKKSALIRYSNHDFIAQLHLFSDTTVGINDGYTDEETLQPFYTRSEGQLLHLENSWVGEQSKLTLFADHNFYTLSLQINNLFAPDVDALVTKDNGGEDDYRFRFGGSFDYKINQQVDVVVGLEHETRSVGDYRLYFNDSPEQPLLHLIEQGKVDEFSAYSQLDYKVQNWRFLIGGRYTDNELSGIKMTPRAAIVYQIDQYQSLKALYSTGFNSPNPTQTSINLPGNTVGNEFLTAEVVNTYDFAYSYAKDNVLFVANVYSLEAQDFIIRRFSEPLNSVSFFNEGNYTRKGAELDFQMANQYSKVFANLAYQDDGDQLVADDLDAFRIPKYTFNIGASYDFANDQSIGADIAYVGERSNLDDYSVVNVNYQIKLAQFDVFAVVRNVFDQEILNPNNSTQNSEWVAPGGQGVNFQLGVRLNF